MNERQALGQFYTPRTVIAFIFDMLMQMDSRHHNPRIIDPACGDGSFLSYALIKGITGPERLFGMDVDRKMEALWNKSGLSKLPNLYVRDGLHFEDCSVELRSRKFDWVVGNPPFGGDGISRRLNEPGSEALIRALKRKYELWKHGLVVKSSSRLSPVEERRLSSFPVEILFLERFVQLAKPNGRVAIILPDGIFANARMQYVRDWILEKTRIEAIVSLPRGTFHATGTSAKTSVLFLTRKGPKTPASDSVMLASADEIGVKDSKLNQLPYIVQRFARGV